MQKIQIPIGMLTKGSVINVEFPFDDDNNKSKGRPAIVIDFNQNNTRVIILKVTTHQARSIYDYPLIDASMANLKSNSVVRCNHTLTLSNEFKCEKRGNLSRQDALAVEILYNQALNNNELIEV